MDAKIIEVGDIVEWSSQASGTVRTKRGEVIEVVRAGQRPTKKLKDMGWSRRHDSYVVRASVIDGSESQKNRFRMYWPMASKLEKVVDATK